MNKERKPEERMNQGPLVPEQEGNNKDFRRKSLIMKRLDYFFIALFLLFGAIVVTAYYMHEIYAMFTELAEMTEPKQEVTERPVPQIGGQMIPAVHDHGVTEDGIW